MTNEEPTYSVQVGLTISPKPYESVRVDIGYHGVAADTLEAAIREGQPVVERLFATALHRAMESAEQARAGLYPDGTLITNSAEQSAILPEPDGDPDHDPTGGHGPVDEDGPPGVGERFGR